MRKKKAMADIFAKKPVRIAAGLIASYFCTFVLHFLVFFKPYRSMIEYWEKTDGGLPAHLRDTNIFLYLSEQFFYSTVDAVWRISGGLSGGTYNAEYFSGVFFLLFAPCALFLFKQNLWTCLYLVFVMCFWIILPNLMSV